MNWKEWFENVNSNAVKDVPILACEIEQIYQMFKARSLDEVWVVRYDPYWDRHVFLGWVKDIEKEKE